MTRILFALVVVVCAACASSARSPSGDGGLLDDAGIGGSGGTAGSGGTGGTGDGGLPASYECDPFAANACDAGFCAEGTLSDGGFGSTCAPGCDVVGQNCGAGLKCEYVNGARACLDGGTLPEGSNCLGNTGACAAGTMCTLMSTSDGGTEGSCRQFCRVNANCPTGKICNLIVSIGSSNEKPRVCSDAPKGCNLFTQNCSVPGQACYPTANSGPVCLTEGGAAVGSACATANACVKGSACAGPAGNLLCRPLCQFPATTGSCGDAGMCTRLSATPDAGVCQ